MAIYDEAFRAMAEPLWECQLKMIQQIKLNDLFHRASSPALHRAIRLIRHFVGVAERGEGKVQVKYLAAILREILQLEVAMRRPELFRDFFREDDIHWAGLTGPKPVQGTAASGH